MTIDRLRAHWGFTRMPFAKDLAPSMLHAHRSHAEAVGPHHLVHRRAGDGGGHRRGRRGQDRGRARRPGGHRRQPPHRHLPRQPDRRGPGSVLDASSRPSAGRPGSTGPRSSPRPKTPSPPKSTNGGGGSCWSWTKPTCSTPTSSKGCGCSTNADMDSHSPFACLLVGQPTLRRRIRLGAFAALDQRVALRYSMTGMEQAETAGYVAHHLKLAGRSRHLVLRRRPGPHPPGVAGTAPGGQQPGRPVPRRRLCREQGDRRRVLRPGCGHRGDRGVNRGQVTVEVDHGSASSWDRPAATAFFVRVRRGEHSLVIAIGLSRSNATSLAERLRQLLA